MKTPFSPHLLAAERLNGGVIITFDDGKCAVYSASLLYATLDQAIVVEDEDSSGHPRVAALPYAMTPPLICHPTPTFELASKMLR